MVASNQTSQSKENEMVTLGGGCFWCLEPVFEELEGVIDVSVGYAGGKTANPSYQMVCTGITGHAEVVQVTFDPQSIPLRRLLEVFFSEWRRRPDPRSDCVDDLDRHRRLR